jgi:hypothetical protein
MQDNRPSTWPARDGGGRIQQACADGYPGAGASRGGQPVAEAAEPGLRELLAAQAPHGPAAGRQERPAGPAARGGGGLT